MCGCYAPLVTLCACMATGIAMVFRSSSTAVRAVGSGAAASSGEKGDAHTATFCSIRLKVSGFFSKMHIQRVLTRHGNRLLCFKVVHFPLCFLGCASDVGESGEAAQADREGGVSVAEQIQRLIEQATSHPRPRLVQCFVWALSEWRVG